MMRSYVNRLARFSSPDLLAGSIGNPQSLDRYIYALNDSTDLIDLWGLCGGGPGTVSSVIISGDGSQTPVGQQLFTSPPCPNDGSDSANAYLIYRPGINNGGGNTSGGPSLWTVSKNLNRCAAQLAQTKSLSALSNGRIPEVLGSNFFSDVSSLATGSGGLDQGAGVAVEGTTQILEHAGAQVAVGTVTTISTPVSATAGVYNPIAVGTASQSFGGTIAGRIGLGFLKGASIAKIGWDAAMYLAAEAACAAPAWSN